MKMSKRAKRVLAWLLWTTAFLAWCHTTTTAAVGAWVNDRLGLLAFGGFLAGLVAGMTRTKKDDTFIAGLIGWMGDRFGGGKK